MRTSAIRTAVRVLAAVLVLALLPVPAASAAGGGGRTGATGSGDTIISTILTGGGTTGGRRSSGGAAPRCRWHTLTERELLFLVHAAAALPEVHDAALFRALEPFLDAGVAGFAVEVRICDGVPRTDSVRARQPPPGATEVLAAARRQLITRLPPPELTTSPPSGAQVLVSQPVFVSASPAQWGTTVSSTLTAAGRLVDVEARPVALELMTGDAANDGRTVRCEGPGVRWDPASAEGPERQAAAPGACVVRYRTATGVQGRRAEWLGYVQLHWSARHRVDGGPWEPLDGLFSLRLLTRSVREVRTGVERELRRRAPRSP